MDLTQLLRDVPELKELDTHNHSTRYSGTVFFLLYEQTACSLDLPPDLGCAEVFERIDWDANRTYMRVTLDRKTLHGSKRIFDARGARPRIWVVDLRRGSARPSLTEPTQTKLASASARIDAHIGQLPVLTRPQLQALLAKYTLLLARGTPTDAS